MEERSGKTKGPRCGIENCRSKWYEEGEDGYLYCANGHRKGNLVTGVDESDFTTARRQTTRKQTDNEGPEKVYKYYKGKQAVDLYLKCLQLILRHQIHFLIHSKGLPAELETVVLDLWTLRILQLESQIGNIHGFETQSQTFSASEDDSESDGEALKSRIRERKMKSTPNPVNCLALCYLGIVTLRLPVTPGDIHAWVADGKMPYKRCIQYIPPAMRDKLPAYYRAILDPNALLRYERFYSVVNDLRLGLQIEYGIQWPRLNHPLLLFRYLRDLALPLELYDATIRLAGYLGYTFTLPSSSSDNNNNNTGKLGIRHLPESQLAACLIVCVKLIYPFDGQKRYPRTASGPALSAIDWDAWYHHISTLKPNTQGGIKLYTAEELTTLQEKEVLSMSTEQLDQYLDFYQDSFIDEERIGEGKGKNDAYRNALYNFFPIDRPRICSSPQQQAANPSSQQTAKLDVVKAVHATMKPQRVVEEGDERPGMLRPGEGYKTYKRVEDLPERDRRFYEEVARIAGLSVEMLTLAVVFAERGVGKWMKRKGNRVDVENV